MESTNYPKNQHYVPQFLLRRFAIPGTDQIFCFNKDDKRKYKTNIRNVASENYFYDIEPGKKEFSIEHMLGSLEDKCSEIIDKIISEESVRRLDDEEKSWIATFVMAQYHRTKGYRSDIKAIDLEFQRQLKSRGIDPYAVANYQPFDDDEDIKKFSIFEFTQIKEFIPVLLNKIWFTVKSNNEFWISDNPVVLHNELVHDGLYGNIGFAVPGIEIYLPLSPSIILGFLDPKAFYYFENEYQKNYSTLKRNCLFSLQNYVNSIRRKIPIESTSENIEYYNSLQLMYSENKVFSNNFNFDFADRIMTEQKGKYKRPQMTFMS